MGNLFTVPEYCSCCKEKGNCVWMISYENTDIDEFCSQNNILDPNVFFKNPENINMKKITAPMDFASEEAKKVKHITGYIRISMGNKINMVQFLCDKCYKTLDLSQLPEEWGFDVYHDKNGYSRVELP